MTGPTHRQYSICFGYIVLMLLYKIGVSQINYYLALPIMLMTARAGAVFPDLDHIWKNVGEKTFFTKIVNWIIHITGGKHRSWQTHSLDICAVFTAAAYTMPVVLFNKGMISVINKEVMFILLLGFASGWVSHMFSDMLTPEGIRIVFWSKYKLAFVPKRLFGISFSTGSSWEAFNYKTMRVINAVLTIVGLLYPILTNAEYVNKIMNIIK